MEIDEIYKRFPHINPALINELYRTFKNQVLHSVESDTEDNRKTNLAVAFGNLLAYEPLNRNWRIYSAFTNLFLIKNQ